MKAIILLLVLAAAGYYGYQYFVGQEPPPPPPRLAAPGVFFTKERFSESTDFGVRALRAGSQVKLLSKDDTFSVVVDENGNEFKVPTDILTNDLDLRDSINRKLAKESAKASLPADTDNSSRDARIAALRQEIAAQNLRIEELKLSQSRANQDLQVEAARSKQSGVSGNPMQGERQARSRLEQIDSQMRTSQRKIQDAEMAIRRLQVGAP